MGADNEMQKLKAKDKKQKRKEELERIKAVTNTIAVANRNEDPMVGFPAFQQYDRHGLRVSFSYSTGETLSAAMKHVIQLLLKNNMEQHHDTASWPAEFKLKQREMVEWDARYLFVHRVEESQSLEAFQPTELDFVHPRNRAGQAQGAEAIGGQSLTSHAEHSDCTSNQELQDAPRELESRKRVGELEGEEAASRDAAHMNLASCQHADLGSKVSTSGEQGTGDSQSLEGKLRTEGRDSNTDCKASKAGDAAVHVEEGRCAGNVGEIIGFVHYRFVVDDGVAVLYLYELQLDEPTRKHGLGKFLMQLMELIARKNKMTGIRLTVQKSNTRAMSFYLNKLKYRISPNSPSQVERLNADGCTYEILEKLFC
eukprot:jgi/Mesen1/2272/ME000154S01443